MNTDPLEKVIRPIVEGQIRGFLKEHPSILLSVDWYKPRQDKLRTLVNSLSKRIIRDLTCPMVRARLTAALLEESPGTQPKSSVAILLHDETGSLGTVAERAGS